MPARRVPVQPALRMAERPLRRLLAAGHDAALPDASTSAPASAGQRRSSASRTRRASLPIRAHWPGSGSSDSLAARNAAGQRGPASGRLGGESGLLAAGFLEEPRVHEPEVAAAGAAPLDHLVAEASAPLPVGKLLVPVADLRREAAQRREGPRSPPSQARASASRSARSPRARRRSGLRAVRPRRCSACARPAGRSDGGRAASGRGSRASSSAAPRTRCRRGRRPARRSRRGRRRDPGNGPSCRSGRGRRGR